MSSSRLTRRAFFGGLAGLAFGCPLLAGFSAAPGRTQGELLPVRSRLPNPYMENGKPVAVIIHGTEFAPMLAKGMEILGGFARFGTDKSVVVKPNFILPRRTRYPTTSDPDSVLTTVQYLQHEGFGDITVADSRNLEDGKPGGMFKYGGVNDRAETAGFKTDALRDGRVVSVRDERWTTMPHAGVFERIYTTDLIISMPTVKQHLMTGYTCALKNNMGTLDDPTCMLMHHWSSDYRRATENEEVFKRLCRAIAETATAVGPELTIIDARTVLGATHLSYAGGQPREANRLIICGDSLAADVIAANVFKEVYEPFELSHSSETFALAADLDIGVADLEDVVVKEASV